MKRSVILTDRLGPDILSAFWTKGQVLHRERAHLKVPGSSIVLNVLLTRKLPTFLSRLNEISGGCEKIALVSGSFCSILKLRHLSDTSFYAKVEKDLTTNKQKIVKDTIQNLIVKQELPATATNLIITTPRTSCIYFLPKIHKPNNPGRPIVSACSCPTELISSYLDKIMAPIVKSLPSYIKDSQHALEIFRDFNYFGQDKLIFTMDISSLYTVIPNSEGLLALKYFFDNHTVKEPSSETLLRLAELVLTLNCFSFIFQLL